MKTIKKYALGFLTVAALVGCKDKMIELNTNPDLMSDTNPEYMFLGATSSWDYDGRGWPVTKTQMNWAMQYQVPRQDQWGESSPYVNPAALGSTNNPFPGNFWDMYYSGQGTKLHSLIKYIDDQKDVLRKESLQEMRAISAVLEVFQAWRNFQVYGGMVYTEAFRASDGIIKPGYDMFQNEYKRMDSIVAAQIGVLLKAAPAVNISVGKYDGFYGITFTANDADGGGTMAPLNNAMTQRARWAKFANAFRLKMALLVRQKDAPHFQKVLGEVVSSPAGLMSNYDEGCEYKFSKNVGEDLDDGNQVSFWRLTTLSYVNAQKMRNDPRLPVTVRMNDLDTSLTTGYKYLYTYFPDSLDYRINKLTGVKESWNGVLRERFQGMTASPDNNRTVAYEPGKVLYQRNAPSITINNPNGASGPYYRTNTLTGVSEPVLWQKDTTVSMLWMVSPVQGRLWLKNGGSASSGWNGGPTDIPEESWEKIRLTRKVFSYAEQCFMMALIANYPEQGGSVAGKTTDQWYADGIRASMFEVNSDGKRVFMRPSTYKEHAPFFVNVNGTVTEFGFDQIAKKDRLYTITTAMAEDYISKWPLPGGAEANMEQIALQLWIHLYQESETMWTYYKLTGYPRSQKVEFTDPQMPGTAANPLMETPYKGANRLIFPRRSKVPTPNDLNIGNWYQIQKDLVALPEFKEWDDLSGRIWWDVTPVKQ